MNDEAAITLRAVARASDVQALRTLDASHLARSVIEVEASESGFVLREVACGLPFTKTYDADGIARDFEHADLRCIAEDASGRMLGVAIACRESWNRSVLVTGLFVVSTHRGLGLGRRLLTDLERQADAGDARCLLVETQNTNVAAVRFYRALGFALCGVNVALYDPATVRAGECALYFMRPLPSRA
ncbi:MAG TPA: GNAT family N-acetyltransferase [Burkholderiaceae bacterium]